MTVADPPTTDAEVCGACLKVRPARSIQQCTLARAEEILARGYCMCPKVAQEAPGGLAALSIETQEIYRELVELSAETSAVEADEPEPVTTVDLIPVEKGPQEPSKGFHRRKGKKRKERRTVKVVQLQPVADPSGDEPVWTHPAETPANSSPIPVIDGGGVITGPQPVPEE